MSNGKYPTGVVSVGKVGCVVVAKVEVEVEVGLYVRFVVVVAVVW